MKLLSEKGRRAWGAIEESPQGAIVLLDLDGTVFTSEPLAAPKVNEDFQCAFSALAARMGAAGYLTGRSVKQVKDSGLGYIPNVHTLGQFGAEYEHNGHHELWVEKPLKLPQARARLDKVLEGTGLRHLTRKEMNTGEKGFIVEDEKSLILAVHYSAGLEQADVNRLLAALDGLALDTDLALILGHGIVEIGPPRVTKKSALERFLREVFRGKPSAVLYAGDSPPDLGPFEVLDHLSSEEGGRVPTLKVCASDDPALKARADLVVNGPMGTLALVKELCKITAPRQRQ